MRDLLDQLAQYENFWLPVSGENFNTLKLFREFLRDCPSAFGRSFPGHITGSAFIVRRDSGQLLLTLHRKLNKWIQLGGHCDGETDVFEVAKKETYEESGLSNLVAYPSHDLILDLDIHEIPATPREAAHLHYDVRYLFMTDETNLRVSDESHELRWFSMEELKHVTQERSIHRALGKIHFLSVQPPEI